MKKKYITCAGIVAALILVGMFVWICSSAPPVPFLTPVATIDPVTEKNVDANNMMILTGSTTLPEDTYNISLTVSAPTGTIAPENATSWATIRCAPLVTAGSGGQNRWRGVFDISGLQPGDYTITFETFRLTENYTRADIRPLATARFTLNEENSPAGSIRKKTRVQEPFIRINPPDRNSSLTGREISGITSLSPGTALAWSMYPVTNGTVSGIAAGSGTTLVTEGADGVNRWAVLPGNDISEPARYRFRIISLPNGSASPEESVASISEFEYPSVWKESENASTTAGSSRDFLTIDALPDIHADGVYILTGTTSLAAGNVLSVSVIPASFETDYSFSLGGRDTGENRTLSGAAVFSGSVGSADIVNGTSGTNLWSYRQETYQLTPGKYQLIVSNDTFDKAEATLVTGGLSCSKTFTISGDAQ